MRPFADNKPLTDAELDRLSDFLKGCKGGRAMNLEELDGFFSALIAGPEPVMPSEYNREIFGGEMSEVVEFSGLDEAQIAASRLVMGLDTQLVADRTYFVVEDGEGISNKLFSLLDGDPGLAERFCPLLLVPHGRVVSFPAVACAAVTQQRGPLAHRLGRLAAAKGGDGLWPLLTEW